MEEDSRKNGLGRSRNGGPTKTHSVEHLGGQSLGEEVKGSERRGAEAKKGNTSGLRLVSIRLQGEDGNSVSRLRDVSDDGSIELANRASAEANQLPICRPEKSGKLERAYESSKLLGGLQKTPAGQGAAARATRSQFQSRPLRLDERQQISELNLRSADSASQETPREQLFQRRINSESSRGATQEYGKADGRVDSEGPLPQSYSHLGSHGKQHGHLRHAGAPTLGR